MDELISKLGIKNLGEYETENEFFAQLSDSDMFGRVYSTINTIDDLVEVDEDSTVNNMGVVQTYTNDVFTVELIANFDDDTYMVRVSENDTEDI